MNNENVFIGTIKKHSEGLELIEEENVILIRIRTGYIKLDSIYNNLSLKFMGLLKTMLYIHPTSEQELYIDKDSLRHYYPEEERMKKLSLEKLKPNI